MFINWPWLRLYAGRDAFSGFGLLFWFALLPRQDLMDWTDEGDLILAALHVEVRATWRVFGRLRPRVHCWAISRADEITLRIAERAGQFA